MELTLASNIREFRKERKLTQEQLAEVLGVTAGAVYKWESGLSVPELSLLVEIADFFDISVDALLGYKLKDNRIESVGKKLFGYIKEKNAEALPEAEKLLKRYPNNFEVVYACAQAYLFFASISADRDEAERAGELFNRALSLLSQNDDPKVNEATIYGSIASTYALKGNMGKAVELLENYNAGGIYSADIGAALAIELNRPEEAERYLSSEFLNSFGRIFALATGYATVFINRKDYASAQKIIDWSLNLTKDIKGQDRVDFSDKAFSGLYVVKAYAELMQNKREEAEESLKKAVKHADSFDSAPNYMLTGFKINIEKADIGINDSFGITARGSLEKAIKRCNSKELSAILNKLI